jgi:hypothetical protein
MRFFRSSKSSFDVGKFSSKGGSYGLADLRAISLSDHFNALEFFYSREFEEITISEDPLLRSVQFLLAQNLAKTFLEVIRSIANHFLPGAVIRVTSGCRTYGVHLKLRAKQKMDPKIVSDHSYMYPYFPLGVGAVDFQIPNATGFEYENILRAFLAVKDPVNFGQLIYYDMPKLKFVHLSNPRTILGLPGRIITRVDASKVLRSDGRKFDSLEFGL